MRVALWSLLCLFPLTALAEYRVFVLRIEKPGAEPRFVESTLDPVQYRGYHLVAEDEVITYTDTWRCRGRTDHRPHCPNPRDPASLPQSPDSLENPATP